MTKEAQRLAIARAVGFKEIIDSKSYGLIGCESGSGNFRVAVPDYLNDLNGMNESEKILDDPKYSMMASSRPQDHARMRWLGELSKVCGVKMREEMVVFCPDDLREALNKSLAGKPPFTLPVGVVILSHHIPSYGYETKLICATAAQRSEALLKACGLWVEP